MLWTIHVKHGDFVISSAATHRVMRAIIVQESWFAFYTKLSAGLPFSNANELQYGWFIEYTIRLFKLHVNIVKCGSSFFCHVTANPK